MIEEGILKQNGHSSLTKEALLFSGRESNEAQAGEGNETNGLNAVEEDIEKAYKVFWMKEKDNPT